MAIINGTPGSDLLFGTNDVDIIRALNGNDQVNGLGGDDLIRGDGGNDTLIGGVGNDRLEGGSGIDVLFGGADNDNLLGGDGVDVLMGDDGDDALNGERGIDLLLGGSGDDFLTGGTGDGVGDFLSAEDGDDTFIVLPGGGSDTFDGGAGSDTLQMSGIRSVGNLFSLESEGGGPVLELRERTAAPPFPLDTRLDAIRSVETIFVRGRELDDSLSVGEVDGTGVELIRFEGGDGNDTLFGSGGPLSVPRNEVPLEAFGEGGDDTFFGGFVNDVLDGGADDDRLDGEVGDDTLLGGDGDDVLDGGFNGADVLDGGIGSDTLIGGARDNPDTFRFEFGFGQGLDSITDFETDERIELSGVTADQVDSNADGVLDNADDGVFVSGGQMLISLLFPLPDGELRVSGFGGADVNSLTIGDDVFFV